MLVVAAALAAATASAQVTTNAAPASNAASKKALVQRVLKARQGDNEAIARNLVEQPAARMMQEAGLAVQQLRMPQDKAAATMKQIETEVKKYVDDALPPVRDLVVKLAPTTIGTALETNMSEDELKQLLAWLESPTAKKYQQVNAEAHNAFIQQVLRDGKPVVEPKLQALDGRIRAILGVPPANGAPPSPAARPASK
jgi:hypothetical protein